MSFKGMVTIQKTLEPTCPEKPCAPSEGEFPAGCTVFPRYPLSSCSALGAHTGAGGAGAVTAGGQPWLGTGCCSCCCFYSLAFLGSAGITYSVLAQMALLWCCSGCEGGGEKPVAVLQIVVNQKSALSHTVILRSGHRQKKCFSFGSCGLNYCCLLPLSRED